MTTFGRCTFINRSMELGGLDLGIFLCAVIEDLNLKSVLGRIARQGSPNAHAVIGARRQLEFKLKNEVVVFLSCVDFGSFAFPRQRHQHAVLGLITFCFPYPTFEISSIEEWHEIGFLQGLSPGFGKQ